MGHKSSLALSQELHTSLRLKGNEYSPQPQTLIDQEFFILCVLVTIDGVWIGLLDLLTLYTINSYLQAIQRY
jgi:hypothetical protein